MAVLGFFNDIEEAVVVAVKKARGHAQVGHTRRAELGGKRQVAEKAPAIVVIERVGQPLEGGEDDVEPAIVVVVAKVRAHSGLSQSPRVR